MLLVTGKKYTGKTTLKSRLVREMWLKNATIYTTRKKTAQDMLKTYYRYISPEEFTVWQNQGAFKFVNVDNLGNLSGVLTTEFEKDEVILEVDFETFKRISSSLPSSCRVVFVDANVETRFDRMLKDKNSIPSTFNQLHKENFKEYNLPFGIIVDNSLNDSGETVTRNVINALEHYTTESPVYANNVQAKRKNIAPLVSVPYATDTRKFLAYEQWAIKDIRRVCNLDNPDGKEFAKIMYRNYLAEFRSLTRIDFSFDFQNKELSIVLDGMYFPLVKDEALMPDSMGIARVKSSKER